MDLKELTDLITIRQYVVNSVALPTIDKKTVNEISGILLLMDKKIIDILLDTEFKEYIGYSNVKEAKKAAAQITNIYSGIENPNSAFHKNIRSK